MGENLGSQMPSPLGNLPRAPPCSLTVNNWLATVTLGQAGMHATYYHKASDQVSWSRDWPRGTRAGCGVPGAGMPESSAWEADPCVSPWPPSCKWAWSSRPAPGCRTQVSPSGTSWICPRPTSSSKVQASIPLCGKQARGGSEWVYRPGEMVEGSVLAPGCPGTLVERVDGAWALSFAPTTPRVALSQSAHTALAFLFLVSGRQLGAQPADPTVSR